MVKFYLPWGLFLAMILDAYSTCYIVYVKKIEWQHTMPTAHYAYGKLA